MFSGLDFVRLLGLGLGFGGSGLQGVRVHRFKVLQFRAIGSRA